MVREWLAKRKKYFDELEAVDYRVIVSVVFLMMFGWIMVYSATSATDGVSTALKQMLIGLAGFVVMIVLSYWDYHIWISWAGAIYLVSVLSLFLVRVPGIGVSKNGASRWISIAGFSFQPSELLKPAMIILMAFLFTQVGRKLTRIKAAIALFVPGAIAVVLILRITSNLSTALIVFGIIIIMFFVAHPDKRIWGWVLMGILAAVLIGLIYYNKVILPEVEGLDTSSGFRATRILAWLYPDQYLDASLQSRYSLYSIGFGGLLGQGLGNGTVKYYLPEPENDFIFAVIAEELGLVGCVLVIFLFAYQVWRIFTIARHAKDLEGSYIALGIGIHVALQAILNIGVATSILPNTGISLPYISYGGSALLIQLCEIGMVLNISRQIKRS